MSHAVEQEIGFIILSLSLLMFDQVFTLTICPVIQANILGRRMSMKFGWLVID